MKKLIIFFGIALLVVGCGSSGSTSGGGGSTPPPSNTNMQVGQSYTVYKGNSIIKDSEDTLITVVHVDGQNESTVTLDQGSATIIRK